MEKIVLNLVKLFIIHAKENNILELDLNELRQFFYILKSNEKYENILYSYIYDENNICLKLEKEIKKLILDNQIQQYSNYIYIYNINTNSEKHFPTEINNLIRGMVQEYVYTNMQKQKVNMG